MRQLLFGEPLKGGRLVARSLGDVAGLTPNDSGIPGNGARVSLRVSVDWQVAAVASSYVAVGVGAGVEFHPLAVLTPGAPNVTLTAHDIGDLITSPMYFDDSALANRVSVTEVVFFPD